MHNFIPALGVLPILSTQQTFRGFWGLCSESIGFIIENSILRSKTCHLVNKICDFYAPI